MITLNCKNCGTSGFDEQCLNCHASECDCCGRLSTLGEGMIAIMITGTIVFVVCWTCDSLLVDVDKTKIPREFYDIS